jgi:steroid delta-isomerase-like uncharacterized protein
MTTTTEKRELVRDYLNAFNERDWDRLSDLLAEDVVEHGIHEELRGPEEITDFLKSHFDTFPDYAGTTEAMIAAEDTVAVRYTATGTHRGEYENVDPTGHQVEWTGMVMYRIEDDRIAEIWLEEDRLGLLEQLEAVDPPGHLRL